ncbi:MAG TPA: hypothetical protein VL625_10160 [Patescibacteria group bacterium]|jgi:hypothetical protein|nr:hypothetical protein [Patescibacteria group bacterium]
MSCSVISDKINIVMDNQVEGGKGPLTGSALQNPDISRAQLGAMLRRRARTASSPKSARKTFWTAFTNFHAEQCANCNE